MDFLNSVNKSRDLVFFDKINISFFFQKKNISNFGYKQPKKNNRENDTNRKEQTSTSQNYPNRKLLLVQVSS